MGQQQLKLTSLPNTPVFTLAIMALLKNCCCQQM